MIEQRAFPSADKAGNGTLMDRSARWRVLLSRLRGRLGRSIFLQVGRRGFVFGRKITWWKV